MQRQGEEDIRANQMDLLPAFMQPLNPDMGSPQQYPIPSVNDWQLSSQSYPSVNFSDNVGVGGTSTYGDTHPGGYDFLNQGNYLQTNIDYRQVCCGSSLPVHDASLAPLGLDAMHESPTYPYLPQPYPSVEGYNAYNAISLYQGMAPVYNPNFNLEPIFNPALDSPLHITDLAPFPTQTSADILAPVTGPVSIPALAPAPVPVANSATGRFHCTKCMESFKRVSDCIRHDASKHQVTLGLHLCPVHGCPKNQGAGYSRADKVKEHLWKKHGNLGYNKA